MNRRLIFAFHFLLNILEKQNCIWNLLAVGVSYWNLFIWCCGQKEPPEVLCKKGVLRNSAKFTEKHLCQSLFFNKVAGLRLRYFPVNFAKLLRRTFLQNTSGLLLLCRILNISLHVINPFVPNGLFLYPHPLKTPFGFLMFSEGRERVHWEQMCQDTIWWSKVLG